MPDKQTKSKAKPEPKPKRPLGQFQKGVSGNPNGRPRGLSPISKFRKLAEKDLPKFYEALKAKALEDGDVAAIKEALRRLVPDNEPLVVLPLPDDISPEDEARAIVRMIRKGQLPVDLGVKLIGAVLSSLKVIESTELARDIAEIRDEIQSMRKAEAVKI